MIVVVTFYKFFAFPEFREFRAPLRECCDAHGVKGTILIAHEGINATIAGTREGIDAVLSFLRADERMQDLSWKESYTTEMPFMRMKVRPKKEIITMKQPEIDPTLAVGTYVPPAQWNDLISDPDVTVIDTRNEYEIEAGTFKGAINPHTESFGDFPEYVRQNLDPEAHKRVAMYCTGGIRCEKATAYLLSQGFKEVYHLEGGILKYLEEVNPQTSLWEGECFVFDERVTVDHQLQPGKQEDSTREAGTRA